MMYSYEREYSQGGEPMKKATFPSFLMILMLTSFLTNSKGDTSKDSDVTQNADITAAEVAANYVRAIGGIEALKKISEKKIRYRVHMFGRDGYLMERQWKRPDVMRQGPPEADMYTLTEGVKSWRVTPDGRKELPASVSASFARIADIDGPLVDHEKKGLRMEYAGSERYDMSELHHLKLTFEDGIEWDFFFDSQTGLLRKTRQPSFVMINNEIKPGGDIWTYYYDYRQVGGIKIAHLWVQVAEDHVHSFVVEEADIEQPNNTISNG
jgi:hypothetical protein